MPALLGGSPFILASVPAHNTATGLRRVDQVGQPVLIPAQDPDLNAQALSLDPAALLSAPRSTPGHHLPRSSLHQAARPYHRLLLLG